MLIEPPAPLRFPDVPLIPLVLWLRLGLLAEFSGVRLNIPPPNRRPKPLPELVELVAGRLGTLFRLLFVLLTVLAVPGVQFGSPVHAMFELFRLFPCSRLLLVLVMVRARPGSQY